MAPPYDVISPEYQEELYSRSDFNFIRLILGKEFASDTIYNNRYVRASAFLQGWLRHKIMLKGRQAEHLRLRTKIQSPGEDLFTRRVLSRCSAWKKLGAARFILMSSLIQRQKLDRPPVDAGGQRQFSSRSSPSFPIKKEKITRALKAFMKRQPTVEAKDEFGTLHRLWRVDRQPAINKVIQENEG